MHIIHINFSLERSIDDKLAHQAEAARALGLPIDFVAYSRTTAPRAGTKYRMLGLPGKRLGRYLGPKLLWPIRLRRAVHACDWNTYDVIVMRYPKLPLGWTHFLARTQKPAITEHHTDEVAEVRGQGGFIRRMATIAEISMRKRFLRRVAGIIGVTEEIVSGLRKDAPDVPSAVIANGVAVDAIPLTGFLPFDGERLALVFMASRFSPWHGLERVLEGLDRYRGPVRIELSVIGSVSNALRRRACRSEREGIRIRCTGPLCGAELDETLGRATLAFASLALYKNGLRQACPLKAREYTARGIPFVFGYEDPDIPDDCPFVLRVENNDTPLDMREVIRFAKKVSGTSEVSRSMREHALLHMDWSSRMRAMYDFVNRVHAGQRSSRDGLVGV